MDISVVIPCYRAGRFLRQAVESALAQEGEFRLREVLIIDDFSEDETTLRALDAVGKLPGVQILSNRGKKGSAGARNTGIRAASGDWIAFLDADDWWPAGSLQARTGTLKLFPGAQWIGGDFVESNRDGAVEALGRFHRNLDSYPFLRAAFSPPQPIRLQPALPSFIQQSPTHTIVSLIQRQALLDVGLFDEALLRQQDVHLFLRLANIFDFVFVPDVVAYYRLHDANSTKSITQTQEWRIRALLDLRSRADFRSHATTLTRKIADLHLANSFEFRRERDFGNAIRNARLSLEYAPFRPVAWKCLIASMLHIG